MAIIVGVLITGKLALTYVNATLFNAFVFARIAVLKVCNDELVVVVVGKVTVGDKTVPSIMR